jgi:ribonuclease HII
MLRAKKTKRRLPDFSYETSARDRVSGPICGIDEAGRGPWAGPVVAAAAILDPQNIPPGIADSKMLKEADRERLFDELQDTAIVGVGIADVARIDRDNILAATMWAMSEAVRSLDLQPDLALVDGNRAPPLTCLSETIVQGDALVLSIAAASIIAKVTRDRIMRTLAERHPGYGWERNKGYGTKEHQAGLARLGVCSEHRRSFKPIRLALQG